MTKLKMFWPWCFRLFFVIFSLLERSNELLLRNRMGSYMHEGEKSTEESLSDGGDSAKETAIIMKLLMKEPVKITVYGHIKFARVDDSPSKLPKTSLLRVFLAPFRNGSREVDGSSNYKVYDTKGTYVDWSRYQKGKPMRYTVGVTVPREWLQRGVTYHIFAILNHGYISPAYRQAWERPRQGDYVATSLFTLQEDLKYYRKDLRLRKYYPPGHTQRHQRLHHFDKNAPPVGLENTPKSSKPKYFM